jgi:cystathionine beta-lyase/cystathionine gamma-synthase
MMSHGYEPSWSEYSVKPPLFLTSTFAFPNAEAGKHFFAVAYGKEAQREGEVQGLIYSRLNNPNLQILEERLAVWENADEAAVFESGMSAISTVFLAYLKPGDRLLLSNPVYGGTHHFAYHYLTSIGVHVTPFDATTDLVALGDALIASGEGAQVRVLHAETPANPTNAMVDLEGLNTLRRRLEQIYGTSVLYAVDNTYMGPIWQKPLEWGADLSVYSATKYLSGHSDLIAGAVVGRAEVLAAVKGLRTFIGNMASPFTCWLLTRSLETLALRMAKQTEKRYHHGCTLHARSPYQSWDSWIFSLRRRALLDAVKHGCPWLSPVVDGLVCPHHEAGVFAVVPHRNLHHQRHVFDPLLSMAVFLPSALRSNTLCDPRLVLRPQRESYAGECAPGFHVNAAWCFSKKGLTGPA